MKSEPATPPLKEPKHASLKWLVTETIPHNWGGIACCTAAESCWYQVLQLEEKGGEESCPRGHRERRWLSWDLKP